MKKIIAACLLLGALISIGIWYENKQTNQQYETTAKDVNLSKDKPKKAKSDLTHDHKLLISIHLDKYTPDSTPLILCLTEMNKQDTQKLYVLPYKNNNATTITVKPAFYEAEIYPPLNKDGSTYETSNSKILDLRQDRLLNVHYRHYLKPDPARLSDLGDYLTQNRKNAVDKAKYDWVIDKYRTIIKHAKYLSNTQKQTILKHYKE